LAFPDISTELACGYRHVPFKALAIDTTKFVLPEYLPEGITICDPRNMKKDAIQSFFTHIKQRQDKQGAENTFRFKIALGKHHEIVEAHYPTQRDIQASPRKRKGKEKATAPNNTAPNSTAPNNPAQTSAPDGMMMINQALMARLLDQGYPSISPFNGPNDGDPQYAVPVADLERLNFLEVPARSSIPLDPVLLSDHHVAPRPKYGMNTPGTRSQTRTGK
jgi:hypothetical protein